ncbi:hypothetical protein EDD37DRAFT_118501 [Exophiala viscosa]|uniref:Uncharacterized protein n=1 Tax=Exophiala viscosa TaxID=2486360 RepID=A0AAN6DY94_9EURO|nr:hypothetical protein EDD36DRAFT_228859 [Exophiala viscosa]KAI1621471.1 hypothetical protein EDD37DRAFT_118501 [Exophiala viscosa]
MQYSLPLDFIITLCFSCSEALYMHFKSAVRAGFFGLPFLLSFIAMCSPEGTLLAHGLFVPGSLCILNLKELPKWQQA